MESIIAYYKVKNNSKIKVWEYYAKTGLLPFDELDVISEQDYLGDRPGKSICNGSVINKVETKFGIVKDKLAI